MPRPKVPENFCPVPFASLTFNPAGNVGCCREQGAGHSVGNIREQTVDEIWNGEKVRAWRREFLTGNIKTCAEQIRHRQCNKTIFNQELVPLIEPLLESFPEEIATVYRKMFCLAAAHGHVD